MTTDDVTTPSPRRAQRYYSTAAWARMGQGRCPECGHLPEHHGGLGGNAAFCSLRDDGVDARIDQYRRDMADVRSHLWDCGCLRNTADAHRVGCPDHPKGVNLQ